MSKTILVVDDSTLARILAQQAIKEAGGDWTVLEAENGEKALTVAGENKVDVALLDVNMPGMDGLAVAEQLNKAGLVKNICFVTANIQEATRVRAEELNAFFIDKPINAKKLHAFFKAVGVDA